MRIIHGRALYTGKYGNSVTLLDLFFSVYCRLRFLKLQFQWPSLVISVLKNEIIQNGTKTGLMIFLFISLLCLWFLQIMRLANILQLFTDHHTMWLLCRWRVNILSLLQTIWKAKQFFPPLARCLDVVGRLAWPCDPKSYDGRSLSLLACSTVPDWFKGEGPD